MVIPSEVAVAGLGVGRPAEFASPDDEGILQHATFLEILEKSGGGAVHRVDLALDCIGYAIVVIPSAVVELDKAHSGLGESAGKKAIGGEGSLAGLSPVALENLLGFPGDVHQPRNGALHTISQLEGIDTGLDLRIARLPVLDLIEGTDAIDSSPSILPGHAPGVGEEENRVSGGLEFHSLMPAGKKAVVPVAGRHRLSTSGEENDKGRQILVCAAQSVAEPGAHARPAGEGTSGLQEGDRRVMVDGIGRGATDETDVVCNFRHVLEQDIHVHAGLPMPRELVLGGHHVDGALSACHGGQALISTNLGR